MDLREYQTLTLNGAIKQLSISGKALVVIPTGGGKTVIFAHICKRLPVKTLVIAHTRELLLQAKKTLSQVLENPSIVDIKSIQLVSRKKNLEKIRENKYEMVIIDECHRGAANSYINLVNEIRPKYIIGATATPFRSDGKNLFPVFGKQIESVTLFDLIEMGFLSDFVGYRAKTNTSLRGISTQKGDFISSKLSAVINVKNRNDLIVKEYLKRCAGKKCLAFCASLQHAKDLSKTFIEMGIPSEAIHGYLDPIKRNQIIQDFRENKIQILTNYQILTEGFDDPSIECLIIGRPTLSKGLYMQMIGRGSRIYPGKEVCSVLEFTDNDYSVCHLEQLLNDNPNQRKYEEGEKLTKFKLRVVKELEEEGSFVVSEKIDVIKSVSAIYKQASDFQINLLKSLGVDFSFPISELQANNLLTIRTKNGYN